VNTLSPGGIVCWKKRGAKISWDCPFKNCEVSCWHSLRLMMHDKLIKRVMRSNLDLNITLLIAGKRLWEETEGPTTNLVERSPTRNYRHIPGIWEYIISQVFVNLLYPRYLGIYYFPGICKFILSQVFVNLLYPRYF